MRSAKILVVEDEKVVAIDISNCLVRLGYTVPAVIDSGEEAIEAVANSKPDLVIMDIHLNGDIDGITAAETVLTRFKIPVIYLTAHSDETTWRRAKVTGPCGYILKPFAERDLQIAIELALYKHQMERKLQEREQWLDTIIRSIGEALIVTDADGCIQFVNSVAEALTGWRQAEALGKDLVEVCCLIDQDTGEQAGNTAVQSMRRGRLLNVPQDWKLVTRDGAERVVRDSARPILDCQGNITGIVLTLQDITKRKRAEEKLIRSAFYDELTGLPNRVLFLKRLKQAIKRVQQQTDDCAVLFLDLDRFKAINDRYGHSVGDQVLAVIAQRLEGCLRTGDIVARLGGDEFVVLLEKIKDVKDATRVADRIQAALRLPLQLDGRELFSTASIGIALSTDGYDSSEDFLRDADMAMYQAKMLGKGRYALFDTRQQRNTNSF